MSISSLARSLAPTPLSGRFDVRAFGATGDGKTFDTPAIHAAIQAAHEAGGGTIHFPAGVYLTSSIRLQSRITLSLGAGAVLAAAPYEQYPFDAPEPEARPDAEKLSSFGHSHWRNSLISGVDLEDIAIIGPGRIFGQSLVRDRAVPANAGNKAVALHRCHNVVLRDFSILQGGHFAILASAIDNLLLDNVTVDTQRDGIDIDCCQNVRVSNCSINSPFDDGICLKSSCGPGSVRPTENVAITNCFVSGYDVGTLIDGTRSRRVNFSLANTPGLPFGPQQSTLTNRGGPTGRIKLGTESHGGFRNITIANCVFEYCRGLALESVDGGVMEDITVTNLVMRDIQNSPLFIRLGNRAKGHGKPPVSVARRIVISNVVASNVDPRFACLIAGIPGQPVEDVTISNIRLFYRGGGTAEDSTREPEELPTGYPEPYHFGVLPAYGFFIRHVLGFNLHAADLTTATADRRPPFVLHDVVNANFTHVTATRPKDVPVFVLREVRGLALQACSGAGDLRTEGMISQALLPAGPAQRTRLFLLGDSMSLHYGPALERLLAPEFDCDRKRDDDTEKSTDLDEPKGANGGDSHQVLSYLRRRRMQKPIPPGILLLNCGLHDLRTDPASGIKRVPLADYAANLRAILAEAAIMNQQVVWVRITPVVEKLHNTRCQKFHRFAPDVAAYNRTADEIMQASGVPVLDLHTFTLAYTPQGIIDHIHYDETTREKQAAFLAGGLLVLRDRGSFPF